MKKLILGALLLLSTVSFYSCENTQKVEIKDIKEVENPLDKIDIYLDYESVFMYALNLNYSDVEIKYSSDTSFYEPQPIDSSDIVIKWNGNTKKVSHPLSKEPTETTKYKIVGNEKYPIYIKDHIEIKYSNTGKYVNWLDKELGKDVYLYNLNKDKVVCNLTKYDKNGYIDGTKVVEHIFKNGKLSNSKCEDDTWSSLGTRTTKIDYKYTNGKLSELVRVYEYDDWNFDRNSLEEYTTHKKEITVYTLKYDGQKINVYMDDQKYFTITKK